MRTLRAAIIPLLAATLCACGNVKSTTITEANKDQIVVQVAQSSLPQEEKQLFAAFVLRVTAGQALGGLATIFGRDAKKVPLPTLIGKTVGQVIEEERELQAANKAEEAKKALEEAKKAQEEAERRKRVAEYLPRLLLSGIKVSRGNSAFLGGDYAKVEGELKNAGDASLDKVEVTIYLLDKDGKPIHESTDLAVYVSDLAFSRDNTPLKPNYSRKLSAIVKDLPSGWSGKADVKVTDLTFSGQEAATAVP